ncbi:MAG: hypothetical protein OXB92_13370 [Acidimicrobiaceae bacterium]|nr:hypothetical protein [Acidimicrobiia bacterium]MCY4494839.1 hypothetical protein [Acidimicrobiaceae bacterium]
MSGTDSAGFGAGVSGTDSAGFGAGVSGTDSAAFGVAVAELTLGSGGSAAGAIGFSVLVAVLADLAVMAPLSVRVAGGDTQWTGLGAV